MISLLVAMDENRIIGRNNQLPWSLPEDLKYFKRVTMGHPIIMGRKTHESIGQALPGRLNVVVSRKPGYTTEGCLKFEDLTSLTRFCHKLNDEIFVIGGAEIFKETLAFADRLYITLIHHTFEGDTFFPEFSFDDWNLISCEKGIKDQKNPYDYEFRVYERKNKD